MSRDRHVVSPPLSRSLSPEALDLMAGRFRVLGEPVRLGLLQALEQGERSVGDLARLVGSSQPNVSKHLRILQEAGIVGRRQEGNTVFCFIADPGVTALCNAVCTSLEKRLTRAARAVQELTERVAARRP